MLLGKEAWTGRKSGATARDPAQQRGADLGSLDPYPRRHGRIQLGELGAEPGLAAQRPVRRLVVAEPGARVAIGVRIGHASAKLEVPRVERALP